MRRKLSFLAAAGAVLAAVAVPIAAQGAGAHHTANAVSVTLKEFSITMPKTLKAGPTTFTVTNKGKFPHDMAVAYHNKGTPTFKTATIKPGASVTVTTNLKPGGYVVVCTQGGGYHASQGMIHTFTVGKFSFTTFTWA
jgi:hypothetical protein